MFNIILYEPEIPPNTGNIIRLCVNTSSNLHLIKPLGFNLDEKKVRRAGLDYHDMANINIYETYGDCVKKLKDNRFFAVSTKATKYYADFVFKKGDVFVFGPETRGLPADILNRMSETEKIRVPMAKDNRSLNLSNTVAIVLYEAWRQINFESGI